MTVHIIDKEQQKFTEPVKGNEVDWIIRFECDEMPFEDVVRLFAWLARTQMLGGLQGSYHRTFEHLYNEGIIENRAGIVNFEKLAEIMENNY